MGSKPLTLSQIRRILIVIVGFLLLVVSGMLGYVKYEATAEPDIQSTYIVSGFTENLKTATALKKQFMDEGHDVSVQAVSHKFEKPDGFRLVVRNDENLLKSFKATLDFHKQPAKIVKASKAGEESYLTYPKVFREKKQAEQMAKKIQKKAMVAFAVEQNTKIVSKKALHLTVKDLVAEEADTVEEELNGKGFVDIAVKEIPVEPQADSAADADAEASK